MSAIRVCPIVEGHGENKAVRPLLDRVWREMIGGTYAEVMRPIRQPKSRLVKGGGIERATQLAAKILKNASTPIPGQLILILLDADDDCPAELGPSLEHRARSVAEFDVACVVANVEYETWFIGGISTLLEWIALPEAGAPTLPEQERRGKRWIERHWRGARYSETIDQVKLSSLFHLADARTRCPSFDKLCRTLDARSCAHPRTDGA